MAMQNAQRAVVRRVMATFRNPFCPHSFATVPVSRLSQNGIFFINYVRHSVLQSIQCPIPVKEKSPRVKQAVSKILSAAFPRWFFTVRSFAQFLVIAAVKQSTYQFKNKHCLGVLPFFSGF